MPADATLLEILRLCFEIVDDGVVHELALAVAVDARLEIVLEHPLVVLVRVLNLDWLLELADALRFLDRAFDLHFCQVVQDEVYVVNQFVKLLVIAVELGVSGNVAYLIVLVGHVRGSRLFAA